MPLAVVNQGVGRVVGMGLPTLLQGQGDSRLQRLVPSLHRFNHLRRTRCRQQPSGTICMHNGTVVLSGIRRGRGKDMGRSSGIGILPTLLAALAVRCGHAGPGCQGLRGLPGGGRPVVVAGTAGRSHQRWRLPVPESVGVCGAAMLRARPDLLGRRRQLPNREIDAASWRFGDPRRRGQPAVPAPS